MDDVKRARSPLTAECFSRRSGLTMLEMAISLALASMVFLVVWQLFANTSDVVSESLRGVSTDTARRTALNRMKEEIRDSGQDALGIPFISSHLPNVSTSKDHITFSKRIAFDGLPTDWTLPITYRLRPSENENPQNGVDDDGDGLVDEQILVREEISSANTIIDNVESIVFERDAQSNLIRVTLIQHTRPQEHTGQNHVTSRSISIALRNT